jgi:Fur family transcriptional regulator, ferric uptake regulator
MADTGRAGHAPDQAPSVVSAADDAARHRFSGVLGTAGTVAGRGTPPRASEPPQPPRRQSLSSEIHSTVDQQLRRSRQRYTLGRRQLVDLLAETARPVTIPELIDLGARQSQSSLYRNLAILEQAGAVRRLTSTDDTGRFELAEELSEHHHHLVCSTCGGIEDITLPEAVEDALHEAVTTAQRDRDFSVDAHHLELVGTCGTCS